jgi:dolichol-phosphate mannosyltransferase
MLARQALAEDDPMLDLTVLLTYPAWSCRLTQGPSRRPLLVLPTFNERENLAPIVQEIRRQLPEATIWIVDDNSPDGTGRIADELAENDERIEVFHRPAKLGLGTAYIEAFQRALTRGQFDCVLQMDADFSHDPKYLPQLLEALQDADLVVGSRYTRGGGTENWSRVRKAISRGGNLVARIGLGVKTRDATGGYRVYRRSTLEQLHFDDLKLRGYGFQIEVIFQVERRGLRIVEIPIIFVERKAGTSKMSKDIALEAFLHILRRRIGMLLRRPEPEPDAVSR